MLQVERKERKSIFIFSFFFFFLKKNSFQAEAINRGRRGAGLPDFSRYNIPKRGKI
jgi:hypothetical protein